MGRFVLLNVLGRGPKTVGQAELDLPQLLKILRFAGRRDRAAAKEWHSRAEVVGAPILRLWLTTGYFTGSVSWITDLTPYLPQDVAGNYEAKMIQVSAARSARLITLDD